MPRIFLPTSTPKNNFLLFGNSQSDAAELYALDSPKEQKSQPRNNHGYCRDDPISDGSSTTDNETESSLDLLNPTLKRSGAGEAAVGHHQGSRLTPKRNVEGPAEERQATRPSEAQPEDIPSAKRIRRSGPQQDSTQAECKKVESLRKGKRSEHHPPSLHAMASPKGPEMRHIPVDHPKHFAVTDTTMPKAASSRLDLIPNERLDKPSKKAKLAPMNANRPHRDDCTTQGSSVALFENSVGDPNTRNSLAEDEIVQRAPSVKVKEGNGPSVNGRHDAPSCVHSEYLTELKVRKQVTGENQQENYEPKAGESFVIVYHTQQLGLTLTTAEATQVGDVSMTNINDGDCADGRVIVVRGLDSVAANPSVHEGLLGKVRVGDRVVAIGGVSTAGLNPSDVERRFVRGPRPLQVVFQRQRGSSTCTTNEHIIPAGNARKNMHYDARHADRSAGAASAKDKLPTTTLPAAPAILSKSSLGGLEQPSQDCLLDMISDIATQEGTLPESQFLGIKDAQRSKLDGRKNTKGRGDTDLLERFRLRTQESRDESGRPKPPQRARLDSHAGNVSGGIVGVTPENRIPVRTNNDRLSSRSPAHGGNLLRKGIPARSYSPITVSLPATHCHGQNLSTNSLETWTSSRADVAGIRPMGQDHGADMRARRAQVVSAPIAATNHTAPRTFNTTAAMTDVASLNLTQGTAELVGSGRARNNLGRKGGYAQVGDHNTKRQNNSNKARRDYDVPAKSRASAGWTDSVNGAKVSKSATVSRPTFDEVTCILSKLGTRGISELSLYKYLTYGELVRLCRYVGLDASKRLSKVTAVELLHSRCMETNVLANELRHAMRGTQPSSCAGPTFASPRPSATMESSVAPQRFSAPTTKPPWSRPSSLPHPMTPPAPHTLQPWASLPSPSSGFTVPSESPCPRILPLPIPANERFHRPSLPIGRSYSRTHPPAAPPVMPPRNAPSPPRWHPIARQDEDSEWSDWDLRENAPRPRPGLREDEEASWWLQHESDGEWSRCSSPPSATALPPAAHLGNWHGPIASRSPLHCGGLREQQPQRRNPLLPVTSATAAHAVSLGPPIPPSTLFTNAPSPTDFSLESGFAILRRFLSRSAQTIGVQVGSRARIISFSPSPRASEMKKRNSCREEPTLDMPSTRRISRDS